MIHPTRRAFAAAAAAGIAALTLFGCSGTTDEPQAADTPTASPTPAPDAGPVGPACAGLPTSGPGSPAALAEQPVATAAAQSPALSTLVTAVTQAGLVDTLNSAQNITVFAPTNDAFAKIPPATLNQVLADKEVLTDILSYHVVQERQAPADLEMASLTTLQGGTVATAESGDTYTVNDARVVCGNLQTRNATVYLIDAVLIPKS